MADSNLKRRKFLLGLGGGIAGAAQLPTKWTKPVVDSVMLPAHAQTSATTSMPTTTVFAPCDLVISGIGVDSRIGSSSRIDLIYNLNSRQCGFTATTGSGDVTLSVNIQSGVSASVTLGTNLPITLVKDFPSSSFGGPSIRESYLEPFVSADGGSWQASFDLTVFSHFVGLPGHFVFSQAASVSEILLTRLSV